MNRLRKVKLGGGQSAFGRIIIAVGVLGVLLTRLLSQLPASADGVIRTAAVGDLDALFGTSGKVVTDIQGYYDAATSMVIQPDGRILVAGHSNNGDKLSLTLARYMPDGSLDASFGGGKVGAQISSFGWAVALQPDGKVLAAGSAINNAPGNNDFAIIRYNGDGSLDPSFGNGGLVTTDFFGFNETVVGLAIQKDGRIVATGGVYQNSADSSANFGLARYNDDATLDVSFGDEGKLTTDFFGKLDWPQEIAIQPDDRLLVVGQVILADNRGAFGLVRYNPNGSLDSDFGSGGKVTTSIGTASSATSLAIQPDARIVVGGSASINHNLDFVLARYNSDGGLDTSFGSAGKVSTDFFGNGDTPGSVIIQPDGKILAAGRADQTSSTTSRDFAMARYNADGSLDSTFGTGGKVTTDFFGNADSISSAALQPNGDIVVAGAVTQSAGGDTVDFGVARYIGDSPGANMPFIQSAKIQGKKLIITGYGYDAGAAILLDGKQQKKTVNDDQNPERILIAKKAGKQIAHGQTVTIQVRNPDGRISNQFVFTRP